MRVYFTPLSQIVHDHLIPHKLLRVVNVDYDRLRLIGIPRREEEGLANPMVIGPPLMFELNRTISLL